MCCLSHHLELISDAICANVWEKDLRNHIQLFLSNDHIRTCNVNFKSSEASILKYISLLITLKTSQKNEKWHFHILGTWVGVLLHVKLFCGVRALSIELGMFKQIFNESAAFIESCHSTA